MLKKRIIPCMDIHNGRTVKGVNFLNLRDAGDAVELARYYVEMGADELVLLDISATSENRKTLTTLVDKMAREINIPFTVGGGINSLSDAKRVIQSGADKVSINSAAVKNPALIKILASELGSQCVVVAIDVKRLGNKWKVFVHGGKQATEIDIMDWALHAADLGAGEILLTSMDNDGTKNGFALELLNEVCGAVSIPVIASGGAGCKQHFKDVFEKTSASAALAASVFHFGEIQLRDLKQYLLTEKIPVRWV